MQPEAYARALLERLAIGGVPDARAVVAALKVRVHEKDLERCDGMLVRVKGTAKGVIAVRKSIREETRKLFTIAHEIGHLLLPGHDDDGICGTDAIERWDRDLRAREREANAFAAELLMPSELVTNLIASLQPSLATIERLAETFRTSLTASGYRLVAMTTHAAALVWSQRGQVRWARRSEEFKQWVRVDEQIDSRTFAADLFRGVAVPSGLLTVPADAWLESAGSDATLLEESRSLPTYDAVLTVLWAREPLPERDETNDLLNPLTPEEFSIRRSSGPKRRG
jgi:Zn-dependent peptidase ImmA (M78 family)